MCVTMPVTQRFFFSVKILNCIGWKFFKNVPTFQCCWSSVLTAPTDECLSDDKVITTAQLFLYMTPCPGCEWLNWLHTNSSELQLMTRGVFTTGHKSKPAICRCLWKAVFTISLPIFWRLPINQFKKRKNDGIQGQERRKYIIEKKQMSL